MFAFFAKAGPFLLILGSALTAPLFTVPGLTLTDDRRLDLAALGVATGLGILGVLAAATDDGSQGA